MKAYSLIAIGLLALVAALPATAGAQGGTADGAPAPDIQQWNRVLDDIERRLAAGPDDDGALQNMRNGADWVRELALAAKRRAATKRAETRQLLDALGPPPEDGAPAEAPEVAAQRQELQTRLAANQGIEKQADVVLARIERVVEGIGAARRERLTRALMREGPSLLAGQVWADASLEFGLILRGMVLAPAEWLASGAAASRLGNLRYVMLLLGVIGAVVGGRWLRAWLLRRFGRGATVTEPSYARRLLAAVVEGVARGLIPVATAAVIYFSLLDAQLLAHPFGLMIAAFLLAIGVFSLASAMTLAVFAPRNPGWRCTPFDDHASRVLSRRLIVLAAVFCVDLFFVVASDVPEATETLRAVYGFAFNSTAAAIFLSILTTGQWRRYRERGEGETPLREVAAKGRNRFWQLVRVVAALLAAAVPIAALLDYHELSRFVFERLMLSAGLVAGFYVVHGVVDEVLGVLLERRDGPLLRYLDSPTAERSGGGMLKFWIVFAVELLLLAAVVTLLLPLWGVPWADLFEWGRKGLTGFSIGTYELSFSDVLLGLLVFIVLIAIVRFLQRTLQSRVLPQTRLDVGARHALTSAVGYIGITLAALIAIDTAGLDLSNLAIIAGALSVGIGFGLQAIVNNFVSGIILLVERPIQVGDWVVIGTLEGHVKRISVRATEITTFQRASVIIPNSELISNPVTNWTHKDLSGRIDIPVGVAYGSDTEKVRDVLLSVAKGEPDVLDAPAPQALFLAFGASSLDFQLRCHVAQVNERFRITSNLHFAIDKAFREAGIEIPFSQHDIHLRDIGPLERALTSAGRPDGGLGAEQPAASGGGAGERPPEIGRDGG